MTERIPFPLPEPTFDEEGRYAQVDAIFMDKAKTFDTPSTQSNYLNGLSFYKKFLRDTDNYDETLEADPRFYLARQWGPIALANVKKYLDQTNIAGTDDYLTSSHVQGLISAIRQTMEHAFFHGIIDQPVLNVVVPQAVRETDIRTAYSSEEYDHIFDALRPDLRFIRSLVSKDDEGRFIRKPYQKTGIGCDPRVVDRKGQNPRKPLIGQGWPCYHEIGGEIKPTLDNMRWYFENEMGCAPLPGTKENNKQHKGFFAAAANIHGGLHRVYREFGVQMFVDADIVLPMLTELIAETGLNVESALSLRRDCLQNHPLTGLPILIYYKKRSGGEKELPIHVFDNHLAPDEVEELMPLGQLQSQKIRNCIDRIGALTDHLVDRMPEGGRKYLFIYQSTGNNSFGKVMRVDPTTIDDWTDKLVAKHGLKGDDGKPLTFTLSRFRPTRITEMIKAGYDLLDIFVASGHRSMTTLMAYVDKLKTESAFQKTIDKALTTIKDNHRVFKLHPLPIASSADAQPGTHVFKGPVCHCKHPYDPPEEVRKSKQWREGEACTYFNMCLRCDQVLITEANLPRLFQYRREILDSLNNGAEEIPRQGELYQKNLAILNHILRADGEGAYFTQEQLDWARELAEDREYPALDSFTYHGGL